MGIEAHGMGSTAGTRGQGDGEGGLNVPLNLRKEEAPAWQSSVSRRQADCSAIICLRATFIIKM